jgi:hypothetical protein
MELSNVSQVQGFTAAAQDWQAGLFKAETRCALADMSLYRGNSLVIAANELPNDLKRVINKGQIEMYCEECLRCGAESLELIAKARLVYLKPQECVKMNGEFKWTGHDLNFLIITELEQLQYVPMKNLFTFLTKCITEYKYTIPRNARNYEPGDLKVKMARALDKRPSDVYLLTEEIFGEICPIFNDLAQPLRAMRDRAIQEMTRKLRQHAKLKLIDVVE